MKIEVWITTQFEGFHRWENAPDSVKYLQDWHRHIFHVKLWVSVSHSDRDIEFITLKKKVNQYLHGNLEHRKFTFSCEQIAQMLQTRFNATRVEVSEDGENGATVTAKKGE